MKYLFKSSALTIGKHDWRIVMYAQSDFGGAKTVAYTFQWRRGDNDTWNDQQEFPRYSTKKANNGLPKTLGWLHSRNQDAMLKVKKQYTEKEDGQSVISTVTLFTSTPMAIGKYSWRIHQFVKTDLESGDEKVSHIYQFSVEGSSTWHDQKHYPGYNPAISSNGLPEELAKLYDQNFVILEHYQDEFSNQNKAEVAQEQEPEALSVLVSKLDNPTVGLGLTF